VSTAETTESGSNTRDATSRRVTREGPKLHCGCNFVLALNVGQCDGNVKSIFTRNRLRVLKRCQASDHCRTTVLNKSTRVLLGFGRPFFVLSFLSPSSRFTRSALDDEPGLSQRPRGRAGGRGEAGIEFLAPASPRSGLRPSRCTKKEDTKGQAKIRTLENTLVVCETIFFSNQSISEHSILKRANPVGSGRGESCRPSIFSLCSCLLFKSSPQFVRMVQVGCKSETPFVPLPY
jgi:hypothetical protein